uniref:Uncharacterized protein n=1 Tax=Anguilla anguilla TaxID=7936 RepID=A0A0E9UBW2_ANGAN
MLNSKGARDCCCQHPIRSTISHKCLLEIFICIEINLSPCSWFESLAYCMVALKAKSSP